MQKNEHGRTRALIVGAGISGLTAIKACKEEGLEVVCFEKTSDIGGLWCPREELVEGVGCTLKSTVTNSSKEMSSFSDFPPPDDFPNYLIQDNVHTYIRLYAQNFNLTENIKFKHEVVKIRPASDFANSGKWEAHIRSQEGDINEEYDAVLVCSGQHSFPHVPNLPGMEKFKGEIKHNRYYNGPKEIEGKKVLIIGAGNSAADIAAEAASFAEKVYLSSRRGTWLLPRTGIGGMPIDLMFTRPFLSLSQLPFALDTVIAERLANVWINHKIYGLKPAARIWDILPTINDALLSKFISGQVILKGAVKEIKKTCVTFEDDKEPYEIDYIILATGYKTQFKFLDKATFPDQNSSSLYKKILPPNLIHPTLAMIGFVSTIGSLWPVFEVQSRWAVAIFAGKLRIPTKERMLKEIQKRKCIEKKLSSKPESRDVPFISIHYTDDLATDIGVKPNFMKMALTDPLLFWTCIAGPCLPYQYRLVGSNHWTGARKAIINYKHRIIAPISTRIRINKGNYRSTNITTEV